MLFELCGDIILHNITGEQQGMFRYGILLWLTPCDITIRFVSVKDPRAETMKLNRVEKMVLSYYDYNDPNRGRI